MKPELKHHYQTIVYNYYTANEAAYKAILELGDTPNPDAYKKIAEEHNVNVGDVLNIYHLIRQLKTIGIPVNPPQPVDKSKKVYESSNGTKAIYRNQTNTKFDLILRYKTYVYNYYTANEAVYKAILQLEDTYNPDAYEDIAEAHNVNIGGVRITHYVMRHLKSIGVPVDPPEPVDKSKKVPESSNGTEAISSNSSKMKPEVKQQYQTNVYNYYTANEDAYEALLKLGDIANRNAYKKIAEKYNQNAGGVRITHYFLRTLKRMGVPVDPPEPVDKPKKVPESSKGTQAINRNQTKMKELKHLYQMNVHNFFTKHEAAYRALLELGDTPNQDACKKIAEEHNLTAGTVQDIHYFLRTLKRMGVPVDLSRPVEKIYKVLNKVQKVEEEYRNALEGFKRNYTECYNRLKGIVASDQPLERSDATLLGEKYGLTPEMITDAFNNMKRLAKENEERQEDDGAQVEADGPHEEQEEQMVGGELEDRDPNQPSTSGPPTRTRYEEPKDAFAGEYQFEESSGQWSKQGIRRSRSSGRRSLEENDAIEYFREPSSSSSKKRTKRQGEGDDWLDLDPRTRSAVGTSERRSRRAEKISVPSTISTKRHHPSGSPDAPEAKRRPMGQTEQLEPRGLCEPATSPSPPPEHRNPRGDRGSVLVPRQMEEVEVTKSSRNAKEKFNEIKTHFKAIRNSLSQMTSDDIEEMRTALERELSTIRKTLKKGNGNNSLVFGKLINVRMAKVPMEQIEQERHQDRETRTILVRENSSQAQPDMKAPETTDNTISPLVTIPLESEPKPIVQTRRSVALEEQEQQEDEAVEPESMVQGAEASVGEQMDLGTGESMPHVSDEPAIQTVDQQPEDDSTQNVLPESSVQTQPNEREDMDSTGERGSGVLSEMTEHGIPQDDRGASQMEGADNTHKWFESTYRDINVALEILINSLSQLTDEDVIEIGRSLRIDLKEMKRLLQSSAVSKKIPRKRQFVELSEIINDIKTHLIKLESFLNEVTVEDRDDMSDVLRLDLNKVRMMLFNWNGNEDEAIKEEEIDEEEGVHVKTEDPEPMEQEQQDGTSEDQPEPQVKQEPEEQEPLADSNS